MTADRNNGRQTDGRFGPGNPGRPVGARHKTTLAVEALLDGDAERLTRKAIDLALGGDGTALRLCLERIAPLRKGRTVEFDVPDVEAVDDVLAALGAIVGATSRGELTPDEAISIAGLIELKRRAIESLEIEARIAALEAQHAQRPA
jgi:hypothetical protein